MVQFLAQTTPALAPEKAARPRPMRLLVAEDNAANRMILQGYLGILPIDLVFAENGREALDYWQAFAPDLILMDISMPEMTGSEAARRLRRAEAAGLAPKGAALPTPIIALTAHGAGDAALGPEFSGLLAKPYEKTALMTLLALHCPQDAHCQEET